MTLLTNDQHYQLVKDDKGYAAKRFMFPCLGTSVSMFCMIRAKHLYLIPVLMPLLGSWPQYYALLA